jgi:hypothetical protein
MTPPDKQQLIELAQRYYPPAFDLTEPSLEKRPGSKAYDEAWGRAPSIETWFKTIDAIRKDLPGISLADATPGSSCGSFRVVAYVKDQSLAGGAVLDTMVVGFRSVLAPAYAVAWAQRVLVPRPGMMGCPWRAASVEIPEELRPVADAMARHIERDSGHQRFPAELAGVLVPGISIFSRPAGEVTLFDALFDPEPANVP